MLRARKTNIVLRQLIRTLRKYSRQYKAPVWRAIADELEKPRSRIRAVNVGRINRHTSSGDIVAVPGKVLGMGALNHPVTVAAFAFSKAALLKIHKAGGRAITIQELLYENPEGRGVKLIG